MAIYQQHTCTMTIKITQFNKKFIHGLKQLRQKTARRITLFTVPRQSHSVSIKKCHQYTMTLFFNNPMSS